MTSSELAVAICKRNKHGLTPALPHPQPLSKGKEKQPHPQPLSKGRGE